MRINVYSEEIDFDRPVELVHKVAADTGLRFFGLRVWLKATVDLHHDEIDDDTSAVTFWFDGPTVPMMATLITGAAVALVGAAGGGM